MRADGVRQAELAIEVALVAEPVVPARDGQVVAGPLWIVGLAGADAPVAHCVERASGQAGQRAQRAHRDIAEQSPEYSLTVPHRIPSPILAGRTEPDIPG